MSTTSALQDVD